MKRAFDQFMGFPVFRLGNGDGSFQTPSHYGAEDESSGATVGDFDRDGKTDLAVANGESDDIATLLGTVKGAASIECSPDSATLKPGDVLPLSLTIVNESDSISTPPLQIALSAELRNGREIQIMRPVPRFGFTLPAGGSITATFGIVVPTQIPERFSCMLKTPLILYENGGMIGEDTCVVIVEDPPTVVFGSETAAPGRSPRGCFSLTFTPLDAIFGPSPSAATPGKSRAFSTRLRGIQERSPPPPLPEGPLRGRPHGLPRAVLSGLRCLEYIPLPLTTLHLYCMPLHAAPS
jgi:hypothetical protein